MAAAGRVLLLTSNYPRWVGDSTTPFVHDLALDLRERGWDVTVLAPHAPHSSVHELLDGVEVRRFRYLLPEKAETVCYGGGALVNLRGSRAAKAKLPALVAAEWAATSRALSKGAFDVVHAHWVLPQGFVAATTPFRRIPRVVTVHGGDVFGLRGGVLDRFTAFGLRAADQVTVNSSATEAAVRDIAGAGLPVARIPFGVDLSRYPKPELVDSIRAAHRRGDGPLLVFVGRVVEEKGVEEVVRTVALLRDELPGTCAVVAGTGQHLERVRALAGELGVADRVHLAGWVDPADVPSWFAAADVVLAPSKIGPDGWAEGQGLTIIEAMAVGRPVVSTTTGGIPDTITDGRTGLLVPPADAPAIAAAVRRLMAHPALAERLAREGAASVRSRFDRGRTADDIAAIYRRLTGAPGGAG